jgi:hypothetical protein
MSINFPTFSPNMQGLLQQGQKQPGPVPQQGGAGGGGNAMGIMAQLQGQQQGQQVPGGPTPNPTSSIPPVPNMNSSGQASPQQQADRIGADSGIASVMSAQQPTPPVTATNFSGLAPSAKEQALTQVANQHQQGAADAVTLNPKDPSTPQMLNNHTQGSSQHLLNAQDVTNNPSLNNFSNLPHQNFSGLVPTGAAAQNGTMGDIAYNLQQQRFWNNYDFGGGPNGNSTNSNYTASGMSTSGGGDSGSGGGDGGGS